MTSIQNLKFYPQNSPLKKGESHTQINSLTHLTHTHTLSSANLLGSGGFGAVYKAMYRGGPVAVKVFSDKTAKINNTTPNYLLRLEVQYVTYVYVKKHVNGILDKKKEEKVHALVL